jgi:hypothetical protein
VTPHLSRLHDACPPHFEETMRIVIAMSLCLSALSAGGSFAGAQSWSRDRSGVFREIPFDIASNKPWVPVQVNGSGPQSFILDTGSRSSSVIGRECADRLHLPLGDLTQRSIGGGQGVRVGFTSTPNAILEIAGDTLSSPAMPVFELAHVMPYEGRRLDGLLGEDFMRRHVVQIDYQKKLLRIYEPDSYHYTGRSAPIPITLDTGLATAEAEVTLPGRGTLPCRLVIDTGVRTTLIWYHPFVVAHDLVAALPRVITGTIGGGAGGETKGDVGRIDRLRIGDLVLERPTTVFSRDTTGVFASASESGIVGGELLRRCRVTFDYPHSRLMLEPYRTPVTDFDYDMSGLFLVAPGPSFERVTIQSVAPGSPAEEAGLAKGDEIVSIDGRKTATMRLDDVRDLLKQDGASRHLRVKRGEDERAITVKLRRLV